MKPIFKQLNKLANAYRRLSRNSGGTEFAIRRADLEFDKLVALIQSDWAGTLDQLMKGAQEELGSDEETLRDPRSLLDVEERTVRDLNVDRSDLEWMYELYLKNSSKSDKFVTTTAELAERLESIHESFKQQLTDARQLPKRSKLKRKRDVLRGAISGVAGTGVIVANTGLLDFHFSYGLGGAAILQAVRDIIGELPK